MINPVNHSVNHHDLGYYYTYFINHGRPVAFEKAAAVQVQRSRPTALAVKRVLLKLNTLLLFLLRTPEGTGALWCTTWKSYLGVYCNGFEDGRR